MISFVHAQFVMLRWLNNDLLLLPRGTYQFFSTPIDLRVRSHMIQTDGRTDEQ